MAYIYQIINDINGKIYVGKTEFSIEKRFKEHCEDAYRERCEKRPLYAAMRKYGIEHFHISLLEETNNPEERECYWIEQLRSFKNGYNATIGGDGRKYLDYDLIIATYNKVKNQNEVARILKISPDSVHDVLKNSNIEILKKPPVNNKIVYQYDLNENFIRSFISIREAARYLGDIKYQAHISQAINGKRKTAYGYIWKTS